MKKNISKYSKFYLSFGITLLVYLLVELLMGFHYETKDDFISDSMIRGMYWGEPTLNFYFWIRGLPYIYYWLYSTFDLGVNYYGFSLIFFSFIAHSILCYLILLNNSFKNRIVLISFFVFACIYNIYLVSFTKVAITLGFSSIILIAYTLNYNKKTLSTIVLIILGYLLFFYAYLLRPFAGIYSFALALCFLFLFWLINKPKIRQLVYQSVIIAIPFIISFIVVFCIENYQDKEYTQKMKQFSDYTGPIVDYHYSTKFSNDYEENILYSFQNWFYFNKETTNLNVLNKIVDLSYFNRINISNIIKLVKYVITKPVFVWFIFILLFLPIFFYFHRDKRLIINLIFVVLLLLFPFGTTIVTKLAIHLIIPSLTIIIFSFFLFFDQYLEFILQNKLIKKTILFLFVLMLPFQVFSYYKNAKVAKELTVSSEIRLETLKKESTNKIVFLTMAAIDFEEYNPLKLYNWNKSALYIPMNGWYAYNEKNYNTIFKLCGSNDLDKVFIWMANNPNVYILSDDYNNKLINKILKYYNIEIEFKATTLLDKENQIYLYSLSIAY